jgi:hypothetical protein
VTYEENYKESEFKEEFLICKKKNKTKNQKPAMTVASMSMFS